MNITSSTILISGGTSGIGRGFAEAFHKLGNKVIITGRSGAALGETIAANPGLVGYELEVGNLQAIRSFAKRVLAEHPDINVLFNNAEIMRAEDAATARDLSDAEETVATNLLGPIRMTDAFIEHLKAQKDATVINTSSGLAFVPMPAFPTYNATKAGIHSYTVGLREALKGKVEFIEVIPPGVQTELTPGQSKDEQMMPLDAFLKESMEIFAQKPTPAEICVKQVNFLRRAEAEGRFAQALAALSQH